MGLLTWRQARGAKREVKQLRQEIRRGAAAPAAGEPLARTPEEQARLAAVNKRLKDVDRAMKAAGFRYFGHLPYDDDVVRARGSVVQLVVREGLTIQQAVERVAAARDAVVI